MMEGVLFDIQRFGLHDGPGVRTVVFLKGCPLSCKWCSNPESISLYPQLSYSAEKCDDSEKCFSVCPENVFSDHFWKSRVDFDACNSCGKCMISVMGREDLELVLKEPEKYANLIVRVGGGFG